MSESGGTLLLQSVAERILARYLSVSGREDVVRVGGRLSLGGDRGIDLTYAWRGGKRRIKVKADSYFGTDSVKISDRNLPFYRPDAGIYAFEAVGNVATRESGWIVSSEADELYYYYLVLSQPEDEVRALAAEPDPIFFSELAVDRDDLRVMPMAATRAWFQKNFQAYTPRPVVTGDIAAWYRLVPRSDLEHGVSGVDHVGPVFPSVRR
jgi:hypothetical protein